MTAVLYAQMADFGDLKLVSEFQNSLVASQNGASAAEAIVSPFAITYTGTPAAAVYDLKGLWVLCGQNTTAIGKKLSNLNPGGWAQCICRPVIQKNAAGNDHLQYRNSAGTLYETFHPTTNSLTTGGDTVPFNLIDLSANVITLNITGDIIIYNPLP